MILGRKLYPVVERQDAPIPLSDVYGPNGLDIYPDVLRKGFFTFTLKGNRITLAAGNNIGLIPLNRNVALYVEPKIAKSNWLYLVGRARGVLKEISYLREYSPGGLAQRPLIDFLSKALILQLREIDQQGLYRQYRPIVETTSFPKGRILFGDSIRYAWSRGYDHRVVVKSFTFDKDTPHNRLLKYALELAIYYIGTVSVKESTLAIGMADLENLFKSIPLDSSLSYLPEVITSIEENSIPDSRDYYAPACSTAILLVENSGVLPLTHGARSTFSFVVNMETIFEDFCFNVLRDHAATYGWKSVTKGKNEGHPLFAGAAVDTRTAEPDIVIRTKVDSLIVIEIKYKGSPNRQDINQAVTYAVSYKTSKAIVMCFSDSEADSGWQYLGKVGEQIEVWIYRLFLESKDLENEERKLAADVNGISE